MQGAVEVSWDTEYAFTGVPGLNRKNVGYLEWAKGRIEIEGTASNGLDQENPVADVLNPLIGGMTVNAAGCAVLEGVWPAGASDVRLHQVACVPTVAVSPSPTKSPCFLGSFD